MELNLSFKQASEIYEVMVFDTCAISGYEPGHGCPPVKDIAVFPYVLQEKMNKGYPCVLPREVEKELRKYRTSDARVRNSVEGLIRAFEKMKGEGFLGIDESVIAKQSKMSYPKYAQYGTSLQDISVLEHGISFLRAKIPTAIVSNDRGLMKAWRDYQEQANVSPARFGFLRRSGLDSFEFQV